MNEYVAILLYFLFFVRCLITWLHQYFLGDLDIYSPASCLALRVHHLLRPGKYVKNPSLPWFLPPGNSLIMITRGSLVDLNITRPPRVYGLRTCFWVAEPGEISTSAPRAKRIARILNQLDISKIHDTSDVLIKPICSKTTPSLIPDSATPTALL